MARIDAMARVELRRLIALLQSKPRLLTAASFGLSGLAFVLANLLLARALPVDQYALMSLMVSVLNVAIVAAPLGIDGAVARGSVSITPALMVRIAGGAAIVALASAVYVRHRFAIGVTAAFLLAACICSGAIALTGAARFQAMREFGRSLLLLRSVDFALFLAGVAAVAAGGAGGMLPPFTVLTLALSIVAVTAWSLITNSASAAPATPHLSWREAGAYLSMQVSASLLVQLERLLTPVVLTLEDLATLGVALAIVGPPFRLLQMTVGYTLQPRLRAARTASERVKLLESEAWVATAIVVFCCGALWYATPRLVDWLLHGKIVVPSDVLLACLISGILKVASGFARASMTALASNRELALVGAISLAGIAVAAAGGIVGVRFGLPGVIYGVASGWAIRVASAGYFIGRQLRRPPV